MEEIISQIQVFIGAVGDNISLTASLILNAVLLYTKKWERMLSLFSKLFAAYKEWKNE